MPETGATADDKSQLENVNADDGEHSRAHNIADEADLSAEGTVNK